MLKLINGIYSCYRG